MFNKKAYDKEYYKENADKIKANRKKYRKANADKIREYQKEYRKANIDKVKEYYKTNIDKWKEYYKANINKIKARQKEYYKANINKIKARKKEYYKENADKIKKQRKEKDMKNDERKKELIVKMLEELTENRGNHRKQVKFYIDDKIENEERKIENEERNRLLVALKYVAKQNNIKLSELFRKFLIGYTDSDIDEIHIEDMLGVEYYKKYRKLATKWDKIDFLKKIIFRLESILQRMEVLNVEEK